MATKVKINVGADQESSKYLEYVPTPKLKKTGRERERKREKGRKGGRKRERRKKIKERSPIHSY